MLKINETLLQFLFVSPQLPQDDLLGIFKKLKYRMFPGEENFKLFLMAQSSDVQFEKAELIIHRLCYESNFPPTFYAIKDVISVEEIQNTKYSGFDSFVPRDHFIHIVNLYILGLYLFFYSSEFRNSIISETRYQRNSKSFAQHRLDAYKDFISEWKYFCLYHDVGYTQEFFGNEIRVTSTNDILSRLLENKDFMHSFKKDQIISQNSFFGSLEILSRLYTWEAVKQLSVRPCSGNNKLFKFFKKELIISSTGDIVDFDKDCAPFLKNMKKLEKVFSNQCLKPLLPIIGENNIAIVGINRQNGEVSFLSLCENTKRKNKKQRKLFYLSTISDDLESIGVISNPYLLLFDDFVSDKYELVYLYDYIVSSEYYTSTVYNANYISEAYSFLEERSFDEKFYGISTEEQMLDFSFEIYLYIYGFIKKYAYLFDGNTSDLKILKEDYFLNIEPFEDAQCEAISDKLSPYIQKVLFKEYTDLLQSICLGMIEKECKPKIKTLEIKDINAGIKKYAKSYKKSLEDFLKDDVATLLIKEKSVQEANLQMLKTSTFLVVFISEYIALNYSIRESIDSSEVYGFDYLNRKVISGNTLSKIILPDEIGGLRVSSSDFMKTYIKDLTSNNKKMSVSTYRSVLDHGFESAKYARSIFQVLQATIKYSKVDTRRENMINILFSISEKGRKQESLKHYLDDYNHIFSNVIFTIMVHNINSTVFKDEAFRDILITLEDSPFTYFSLMCDGIQQWNRPQGLSHSYTDIHPYLKASEEYDIRVVNNRIYLHESNNKNMQARLGKCIDDLHILKNIKSLLDRVYSE